MKINPTILEKKLKSFLQSAMNTATSLTNYIPKITHELTIVVNEYQKSMKSKIVLTDDKTKFDTFKSLREYAYDLVEYDTSDKNNRNKAHTIQKYKNKNTHRIERINPEFQQNRNTNPRNQRLTTQKSKRNIQKSRKKESKTLEIKSQTHIKNNIEK